MGYDAGKSGLSVYMRNVCANIDKNLYDVTLVVEYDAVDDFKDFDCIVVPKFFSKSAAGMLWHMFMALFVNMKKYDFVLILAANRRLFAYSPIPSVGVVHDLAQYNLNGKYDFLRMFFLKYIQPFFGRKLSKVLAISAATKSDVLKHWGLSDDLVNVVYNGIRAFPVPDDSILSKLDLDKYILYVSRIEHPNKNHFGLIEAFDLLPQNISKSIKLVFAGSDWINADVVKARALKSPNRDNIVFAGFTTDSALASLYKNAYAFVFPSFYEGFGLGLVEAMNNGVPCACSTTDSLVEVAGGAALTFDASNKQQIADTLSTLLSDDFVRSTLISRGFSRAKDFSWQKHTQQLFKMGLSCLK